jgi:transposase InsO family protein
VARRRRRRRGWTKSSAAARKAADLVRGDFSLRDAPNEVWVGDLKQIPTEQGPLWLATVLDLHSRRIVGFALGVHHDAELARAALLMAIAIRGGDVTGVIFHTDQGGEYTGEIFKAACAGAGVRQSMGRTGSALDNAAAESWNSTLELELLDDHRFGTRVQARRAIAGYIEEYNTDRPHSTIGMIPPVAYEQARAAQLAEAA